VRTSGCYPRIVLGRYFFFFLAVFFAFFAFFAFLAIMPSVVPDVGSMQVMIDVHEFTLHHN
jgi:lipopolysaccharide export LptBFGC system permease protein LptF